MDSKSTADMPIALLESFWKRYPFHDMEIESVRAIHGKVIIRLTDYTLVITKVTKLVKNVEEFPTSWLEHKWTNQGPGFCLSVETEMGEFAITGRDLRLIRNNDLAVLIPAIDA